MANGENLTETLARSVPSELLEFLKQAGQTARQRQQKLYLVGGAVRDMLLGRVNLDLDLVVEGDAIKLAEELAKARGGRMTTYSRFNTAKIQWERWSIDFAAARIETYRQPGELPTLIKATDILSDLHRRDFTINSIAIKLEPDHWGEIIDEVQGRRDLAAGLIRVLHSNSFQDDATRIWRAVRYEQRLGFQIERNTLKLIRRDLDFLDTLSADRMRNELELCLTEERAEKVLERAAGLGLLRKVAPDWNPEPRIYQQMTKTRTLLQPYTVPPELYLSILCYDLDRHNIEALTERLNLGRAARAALQDYLSIREVLPELSRQGLSNGALYHLLNPFTSVALLAARVMVEPGIIQSRIDLYLNQLRHTKIRLNGLDLVKAGIPSGPLIGQILEKVKEAKLNGKVDTFEAELELAVKISRTGS